MTKKVGMRVSFSYKKHLCLINKIYDGTIHTIEYNPVNDANTELFGYQREIFIKFDNIDEYLEILMRGWPIYIENEKRVTGNIKKDSILYKNISFYGKETYEEISLYKIESILISERAFDIFIQRMECTESLSNKDLFDISNIPIPSLLSKL